MQEQCYCWATAHRSANPVFAQIQDPRKSLESVRETSVVYGMRDLTCLKQSPGVIPRNVQAELGGSLYSWGEEEIASFGGN